MGVAICRPHGGGSPSWEGEKGDDPVHVLRTLEDIGSSWFGDVVHTNRPRGEESS